MIQNSAVLVDLNIGTWTARKADKKVSAEIDSAKNTKARAGNYNKNLMAGTQALDKVNALVTSLRMWHYSQTLPWSDNGQRLLPMSNFFNYKAEFGTKQQELQTACDAFYAQYPTLVSAMALTLGDLFNAADYPPIEAIKAKNYCKLVFSPVPDAGDFRVDIPEQYKAELEQLSQDRINTATRDLWDRMHKCLTHMSSKLAGDDKQIFRDSLIENATELCSVLTTLNVTNDPKLEQARQELEKTIVGLSANDLRKDNALRLATKSRVDEILSMF